jgi:hypothetical protein
MLEPITTNLPLDQVTIGPAESTNLAQLDQASMTTEAGPSTQLGSRRKRKMQAIQEMHSGVDHCLCGVHADSNSNAVVQCKRNGCETKWVCHIASRVSSIKLTYVH